MAEKDTEKHAPTALTSAFIRTPLVDATLLNTDTLVLDGRFIEKVSHDETDNSPDHIASTYLLNQIKNKLYIEMKEFQQQLDKKQLTPVISDPIVPPYFSTDSSWKAFNVQYINGQAVFRNNSALVYENQAQLKLENNSFPRNGTYFLRIEIAQLKSGTIIIKDQVNNELFTITRNGVYSTKLLIENINSFSLTLTINNVETNDTAIINRIYIYHVEERVDYYFNYINESFESGDGTGLASQLFVNNAIDTLDLELRALISATTADIDRMFSSHLGAINPHRVTATDIGAAPLHHTHTANECSAAPEKHTHIPEDCGAAPEIHTHLPEDCGAAPVDHTHTPDQCSAAPAIHNHVIVDLTDGDTITNHLNTNLSTNPHGTTKADVNLGNLENYPVATLDDFIDRSSETYVTPDGACEFLDVLFSNDPTLKYVSYAPKQILSREIELIPENSPDLTPSPTFTLELKPNTFYMGIIDGKKSANMDCLGYDLSKDGTPYLDQKFMNTWITGITSQDTNVMRWRSSSDNMFYLTPPNVGTNMLRSRLYIDTTTITTQSMGQGWIGTQDENDVGDYLTNTGYPLLGFGSYKQWTNITEDTDRVILTFRHRHNRNNNVNNKPCKFTIILYELVAVGTNTNPVDRTPLLTRSKCLGTAVPLGWSIEDGGTLLKGDYGELLSYIEKYNLAITQAEYTTQVTTNGKCPYFVVDTDTITLPTMPCEDVGSNNIIKTSLQPV